MNDIVGGCSCSECATAVVCEDLVPVVVVCSICSVCSVQRLVLQHRARPLHATVRRHLQLLLGVVTQHCVEAVGDDVGEGVCGAEGAGAAVGVGHEDGSLAEVAAGLPATGHRPAGVQGVGQ